MTAARVLRWSVLVLAGAILLALVSIDSAWQPPPRRELAVVIAPAATVDPMLGAEQLAEIAARPLFMSSRRPPEQVADVATAAPPLPPDPLADVILVGIYGSGATAGVLLKRGTEISRLGSGGQWQGWRLFAVGSTEVILLAADGAQKALKLERRPQQGGMVAAPKPANGATAGQPQGSRASSSAERQAMLRAARERAARVNATR